MWATREGRTHLRWRVGNAGVEGSTPAETRETRTADDGALHHDDTTAGPVPADWLHNILLVLMMYGKMSRTSDIDQ